MDGEIRIEDAFTWDDEPTRDGFGGAELLDAELAADVDEEVGSITVAIEGSASAIVLPWDLAPRSPVPPPPPSSQHGFQGLPAAWASAASFSWPADEAPASGERSAIESIAAHGEIAPAEELDAFELADEETSNVSGEAPAPPAWLGDPEANPSRPGEPPPRAPASRDLAAIAARDHEAQSAVVAEANAAADDALSAYAELRSVVNELKRIADALSAPAAA